MKRDYTVWIFAARPKTLIAAISPVFLASALAWYHYSFHPWIFFFTLFSALSIQVATNYFNEVYDYVKGADTEDRLGPPRVVSQGLVSVKAMKRAAIAVSIVALLCGIPLILRGGIPILLIGIFSLFFAWAYTAGPFALAYRGLGEIFVFLFFGVIATCGTYYLHTLRWESSSLFLSFIPGALSTVLLLVNNIRDIPTDQKSGKYTLSVRIGRKKSELLVTFLLGIPYVALLFLLPATSLWLLLDLFSIPYAYKIAKAIRILDERQMNQLLGQTTELLWLHTILIPAALILDRFVSQ